MIPKKFTVGGRTYTVKMYEDGDKDVHNNYGEFSQDYHTIKLSKTVRNGLELIALSDDDILETFCHELGHCFGVYYKDDYSEEFAQAFGHFMFEYFKSLKK